MSRNIIEVRNLVKKYNGRKAILDDISFAVSKAEFIAIYGKSGCGKTTLLNILGGLDRPTSGSVLIDDIDIADLSEDDLAKLRLQKIGFVFQDYNLLMDLTVRENLALPFRFSKKKDGGRVDDLLERFDIKDIAEEKANRISGGEAQRTAIARAMMNEPSIILADEPTGNLDLENTNNVMSILQGLRNDFGTTLILATHDHSLTNQTTRKLLLDRGKVQEADS